MIGSTNKDGGGDDDDGCPICLNDSSAMVQGPCQHSVCWPCMERVVNATGEEVRWPPQSMSDVHLGAPTLGRCPICRAALSLFEICDSKTGNLLVPPNFDYYQEGEGEGEEEEEEEEKAEVGKSGINSKTNPLCRAVYIPYRGKVGQLSFHWDWERLKSDNATKAPFLNIMRTLQTNPEKWRMANGKLAPLSLIHI